MTDNTDKKVKTTRDTWLEAALALLAEQGINNVTINKLSKKLDLAKTSFYWHFKNREDLIATMIDFWVDEFNEILLNQPDIFKADPKKGLALLLKGVRESQRTKYEVAIKDWAKTDKEVAEKVRFAHNHRLNYVQALMMDLGFSEKEAYLRARIFVTYFSNQADMMFDQAEGDEALDMACIDILLS